MEIFLLEAIYRKISGLFLDTVTQMKFVAKFNKFTFWGDQT